MKKSEILWKTQPDKVFAEIAKLLNTPTANATTPGWFSKRLPAISQILAQMTPAEQEELDREGERLQVEGNSEEEKRRSVPMCLTGSVVDMYTGLPRGQAARS